MRALHDSNFTGYIHTVHCRRKYPKCSFGNAMLLKFFLHYWGSMLHFWRQHYFITRILCKSAWLMKTEFLRTYKFIMMMSPNGNIFHVTGHLCGEFTGQRPVRRSFDVFFDLRLNKQLSEQSWGWWFETLLRPLLHYCNDFVKKIDQTTGSTVKHTKHIDESSQKLKKGKKDDEIIE